MTLGLHSATWFFLMFVVGLQMLSHIHWYLSCWRPAEVLSASLKCSFSDIEIMPFVSPWFRAASQAFTKISVTLRFEHKQLPTKCYTTYGLTIQGSDYTTYGYYLGFGLLHTIASKIHIISEGGSECKAIVQSEHSFLSSKCYCMSRGSHNLLSRFSLL